MEHELVQQSKQTNKSRKSINNLEDDSCSISTTITTQSNGSGGGGSGSQIVRPITNRRVSNLKKKKNKNKRTLQQQTTGGIVPAFRSLTNLSGSIRSRMSNKSCDSETTSINSVISNSVSTIGNEDPLYDVIHEEDDCIDSRINGPNRTQRYRHSVGSMRSIISDMSNVDNNELTIDCDLDDDDLMDDTDSDDRLVLYFLVK